MASRFVPAQIEETNRKLAGIRLTRAQVAADQSLVSKRVKEIASAAHTRGLDKAGELEKVLADKELNRIARTYLGEDWSVQRRAFESKASVVRNRLLKDENELKAKVKELESRKRTLSSSLKSPWEAQRREAEMESIKSELATLKGSPARKTDPFAKLVDEYRSRTIGRLDQALADSLEKLNGDEADMERIQELLSIFSFLPGNEESQYPKGE